LPLISARILPRTAPEYQISFLGMSYFTFRGLDVLRTGAEFLHDLDGAVHRIFTGFLYKFILAELIRRYWMTPAAATTGLAGTVSYMYADSLMAATRGRWFGSRYIASYVGFFLSMGLMGIWHGFEPQYVGYGLYHGALLTGHDAFSRWNTQHQMWG